MAVRMPDIARSREDSGSLWVMGWELSEDFWEMCFVFVFFPSWTIKWDVKNLGHSKMQLGCGHLWHLCQALALKAWGGQSREDSLWGHYHSSPLKHWGQTPPFECNWENKERQKTCSASPQIIGLVIDVCPCWASVYPSIKQESCPTHI